MKTKIIILLLALLFISGDFVGSCDEEILPIPDYFFVNVMTNGFLSLKNSAGIVEDCTDTTRHVPITVDITEANGKQSNFFLQSDDNCEFATEAVTIKLYRDQQIQITAYTEQVPNGYTQVRGTDNLNWIEVDSYIDFGETYDCTSNVAIYWLSDR